MKVRIIIFPDRKVSIQRMDGFRRARLDNETDDEYFNRCFALLLDKAPHYQGQVYVDATTSELPYTKGPDGEDLAPDRDKWRWDGAKIVVDSRVQTTSELLAEKGRLIDEELIKPAPDPTIVVRLMREREKLNR